MANDFYKIYREQTTRLAETMVIKFDTSAVGTNRYLRQAGIATSDDRRTWRYYMNMAGLYHSTNRMMQVISLDTGETIDFTAENMLIHRATARGYAYGSRYYYDLLQQHPKQESLILGILNPVDINEAIAAKEGTILWMDTSLVESNEDNLRELIQDEVFAFLDRWHVEMYSVIDDLYDAARIMVLGANLTNIILSARMRNMRTHRAHSFYIQQYLARYGRLDRFMDAMTKEQQLFFYRNVVHFHKYPGHDDSFRWLIDKVMADRNLPIADHTLLQSDEGMLDTLTPVIEFKRQELTRQYDGVPPTRVTVDKVVQKQARLATLNIQTEDINRNQTVEKMSLAKANRVTTKVLESNVFDFTDSMALKLEDLLISYWAYMSTKGSYLALTPFTDQRTGEVAMLQPKDAFIVFLYSYSRANGLEVPIVPVITANHILKPRVPTVDQMYNLTSKKHFSLNLVKAIREMIPEIGTLVSTESFYDTIYQVWTGAMEQQTVASLNHHFVARGEIEAMAMFMFQDVGVDLADRPGQTMSQWLKDRNLEGLEDYSPFEFDVVWPDLLSRATGADLNTTLSLAYIHRAMIGVMERLSSYSVHYIREINEEPLKALTMKWVWPGDSDGSGEGIGLVAMPTINKFSSKGSGSNSRSIELNRMLIEERIAQATGSSYLRIGFNQSSVGEQRNESNLAMSRPAVMRMARQVTKDITGEEWESDFIQTPIAPEGRPIGEVVTVRELSGLNLPTMLGDNIHVSIRIKGLSGINPPEQPPALDLELAAPAISLGGFVPETTDPNWIGHVLTARELTGLQIPTGN